MYGPGALKFHRNRMQGMYTLPLDGISARDVPLVGGKGACLGELLRLGLPVPDGYCVTTAAYKLFLHQASLGSAIQQALEGLDVQDLEGVRRAGKRVRAWICSAALPRDVRVAVLESWREMGTEHAYAIRSSATAEDLPEASFAGQQSSFLGIRGAEEILLALQRCWASLYADRAIVYRIQNGFAHHDVLCSVVVQQMVRAESSGVVFTANPVNGHRREVLVEATFGLGETLVSGQVQPDRYRLFKDRLGKVEVDVAQKQIVMTESKGGGVTVELLPTDRQEARVLDDAQLSELMNLALEVEAAFSSPQDIEWCFTEGDFYVVQSRPITTLFPLPYPPPDDDVLHAYFCFNHVQVMTHPMPPMAVDVWRQLFPFGKPEELWKANPLITSAAGRIYVDVTPLMLQLLMRHLVPEAMRLAHPLAAKALIELREREEFKQGVENTRAAARVHTLLRYVLPMGLRVLANLLWRPMGTALKRVSRHLDGTLDDIIADQALCTSGYERLKRFQVFALGEIPERLLCTFPPRVLAGTMSARLVARLMKGRVERSVFDDLLRGLKGNVTTDMDLAVGDLSDIARVHTALAEELQRQHLAGCYDAEAVLKVDGGEQFNEQLELFLGRYGMRGPSEIDISQPRWQDNPSSLIAVILGSLSRGEVGEHRRKHKKLQLAGEAAVQTLREACGRGPIGLLRRLVVGRLCLVSRSLLALREHPKFFIIQMFALLRTEILEQGRELVSHGQLRCADDVYYLHWQELLRAIEDPGLLFLDVVKNRREELRRYERINPPPVLSSDGEIPEVRLNTEHLPPGALAGTSVSAGIVEGVARVLRDPCSEVLKAGEILVTAFTDPGWTPLFINASALVMEVGGFMTHGSVVAREYGIPAVVGVIDVTQRIKTGQRIRVNGNDGFVEVLSEA